MHSQCADNDADRYGNSRVNALFALVLGKRISRTTPQRCKVARLIYNALSQLLAEWLLLVAFALLFCLFHNLCVLNLTQRYDVRLTKGGRVKIVYT